MKLLNMYSSLIFLMLSMSHAVYAIDDNPDGWTKIDPSFLSEADMRCIQWSDKRWIPKITPSGVSITTTSDPYHEEETPEELTALGVEYPTVYLKYPDGWLVGQDGGEWGGKLIWVNARGETQTLINANTRLLIRDEGSVIAAGGLAHLSLDEGYVAKLSRDAAGKWQVIIEQQTGTSIYEVFKADKDNFIMVGITGVLRFNLNYGIVSKYKNENWLFTYSYNSARDSNGDILVGMPHAVSVLKEEGSTWSESWLVQKSCPYLREVKGSIRCECVQEQLKTSTMYKH